MVFEVQIRDNATNALLSKLGVDRNRTDSWDDELIWRT